MPLSSSFPQGAPTLAEVVLQRTFARPPRPFVDGEFIKALERSDDQPPATDAVARPHQAGNGSSDAGSGSEAQPHDSGAGAASGKSIDIRV